MAEKQPLRFYSEPLPGIDPEELQGKLIVVEGPAPVRHALLGTPVHHREHECLVHLFAVAAFHEAEIDAPLDRHGVGAVAMGAGAVEQLLPGSDLARVLVAGGRSGLRRLDGSGRRRLTKLLVLHRCQHDSRRRLALPQLYRAFGRQSIFDLQRLYLASNTVDGLIDLLAQTGLTLSLLT